MNQQDKEQLIERWLEGTTTEDELLKTISEQELKQYKAILNTVDNWIPEGSDQNLHHLEEIFATRKEAKVVSMNRTPWIISVAASIALIAVVAFLFYAKSETVYYAENERLEIVLPDQSTSVVLSPGASLSYRNFDAEGRAVSVNGRVYFDVTEKGPFEVKYKDGSLSVLGTQFEIVQFNDYFEASCYEGSVQLNYLGNDALMMAGERVIFEAGRLPKIQISQQGPSWINGVEKFENESLIKVIRVMESRYQVSFTAESVSLDRKFTGTIPGDDLELACRSVFTTLGINYEIDEKSVILSE